MDRPTTEHPDFDPRAAWVAARLMNELRKQRDRARREAARLQEEFHEPA